MKREREALALAAILFLSFAAFAAYHFTKMHSIYFNLATGIEPPPEIFLLERKEAVSGGNFTVYASRPMECSVCGREAVLRQGENNVSYEECGGRVEVECGSLLLRFDYAVAEGEPGEWVSVREVHAYAANGTIFIEVSGEGRTNGWKRARIFVDDREIATPLVRLNGSFALKERVYPVAAGRREVRVELLQREVLRAAVTVPGEYDYALLAVLALAFAFLFVSRREPVEKAFAFFIFLAAVLTLHFRLAWWGLGWVAAGAALSVVAWEWRRGTKTGAGGQASLLKQAFVFAAAFALYVAILTALVGKEDVWGSYYYRQAQAALQRGTTDYFDELSYLGRPFTYPPGFMEFAAQAARLSGAHDIADIQLPLNLLVAAFFALTLYAVFERWRMHERILASALFLSEWATLYTATGITLHLYAYGFLNIAVFLLERNAALSAGALALSLIAHPTSLVLFPFFSFMSREYRFDWKWARRSAVVLAVAALLSTPFLLSIFLANGLPSEIVPQRWGYLLSFGLEGLQFDFQFVLVLALIAALYGLWRGVFLPALAILLFFYANAFISFRANLLFAFAIATGVPLILRRIMTPGLLALVLAIVAANYLTTPLISSGTKWWCTWGQANDYCLQPMRYIARYTTGNERVAINPYFGHLAAYHGKRPVLADLYVEWADYAKWRAATDYYEQKNISPLAAYNITLLVLDDLHESRDLPGLDRIYDNGFMHAFRSE
ncbi:MAG: hypothetical protein QXH27_00735 [Candidatus Micrarchaeia archaeon]